MILVIVRLRPKLGPMVDRARLVASVSADLRARSLAAEAVEADAEPQPVSFRHNPAWPSQWRQEKKQAIRQQAIGFIRCRNACGSHALSSPVLG